MRPADIRRRSPHDGRTRRAAATRARIAAAGTELFVRDGYAGTSIASVARAAGVGVQTLYYSYGTKAELLVGCLDHAVDGADRGDTLPELTDRPAVQTALRAPHADRRLFLHVRALADLMARAGALLDVVRTAGDADLRDAWDADEARRRALHRAFVDTYAADGVLAPALSEAQAADVTTLMLGPETWNALVGRAGWSGLGWTRWAHRALLAELMPSLRDDAG